MALRRASADWIYLSESITDEGTDRLFCQKGNVYIEDDKGSIQHFGKCHRYWDRRDCRYLEEQDDDFGYLVIEVRNG